MTTPKIPPRPCDMTCGDCGGEPFKVDKRNGCAQCSGTGTVSVFPPHDVVASLEAADKAIGFLARAWAAGERIKGGMESPILAPILRDLALVRAALEKLRG